MCRARIICRVPLANDAIIVFVLKSATRTSTVYLVKFVIHAAHVNRAVHQKLIARPRKYVSVENVNVAKVSLERHLDAPILMNVPNDHVTRVPFAKIHRDRLDAVVQNQLLAIRIRRQDVSCQINVVVAKIVQEIWPVSKANVLIHVRLPNVDEMLDVKQVNTKHFATVLAVIWAIQLTKPSDVSALNVSATKTAASTNSVIHKRINAKVSVKNTNIE